MAVMAEVHSMLVLQPSDTAGAALATDVVDVHHQTVMTSSLVTTGWISTKSLVQLNEDSSLIAWYSFRLSPRTVRGTRVSYCEITCIIVRFLVEWFSLY